MRSSLVALSGFLVVIVVVLGGTVCAFTAVDNEATVYFVSTVGDDSWSGQIAEPNAQRTDGPFASIEGARNALRSLRTQAEIAGPIAVQIRGGTYSIDRAIRFSPEDSGTAAAPITYMAYPGEQPIISGGRRIESLQQVAPGVYHADIPEAENWQWVFRQLFIDGKRRTLARTPNTGYFYMAGPADPSIHPPTSSSEEQYYNSHYYRFQPGQLRQWDRISEVNIVTFYSWHAAIMPLTWVDEETKTLYTRGHVRNSYGGKLGEEMRFFVENSPDCLDAPGEWQLDRKTGNLTVWAQAGEKLSDATVIAPVARQLLVLRGNPSRDQWVEHLHFHGLSWQHSEFPLPATGLSDTQASLSVSAAVEMTGARHVKFTGNEIAHVGNHGLWLGEGTTHIEVVQNHMHDLGAGGVYVGGVYPPQRRDMDFSFQPGLENGHHRIENNYIHTLGLIHQQAHGIWIGQSSDNVLRHNEISHTHYSAIAIGWSWGFGRTETNRNLIEYNYVHNVVQNVLPDSGGIYTLGVQEGTVIRNNIVHDVWGYRQYQGHGFYPDEGSSGILFENNLVYGVTGAGVGIHWGSDLTFRNNIFAFNASGAMVNRGRDALGRGVNLVFERNIVLLDQGPPFAQAGTITSLDGNLYWHVQGKDAVRFSGGRTLQQWQEFSGWDGDSLVADPGFLSPEVGDFRLGDHSPATQIGFIPLDLQRVGLYGDEQWVSLPQEMAANRQQAEVLPFAYAWPDIRNDQGAFYDTFEEYPVGFAPDYHGSRLVTGAISVSDLTAVVGEQSLRLVGHQEGDVRLGYNIDHRTPVILDGGQGEMSFFVQIKDGASAMIVRWLDETGQMGPGLTINAFQGQVFVGGNPLTAIPSHAWLHVQITAGVGAENGQVWSLQLTFADGEKLVFPNLPMNRRFNEWKAVEFVMAAPTTPTVFREDGSVDQLASFDARTQLRSAAPAVFFLDAVFLGKAP